jgi:hypothetical protein
MEIEILRRRTYGNLGNKKLNKSIFKNSMTDITNRPH